MNRFRFILLVGLLTVISTTLLGKQIRPSEALEKAQQFYHQKIQNNLRSTPVFKLVYTSKDTTSLLRSDNTPNYFYIYNAGNNQGFVIVSGDDATKSILGYSDEGTFSIENMPENLKSWLDFYKSEIKFAVENGWSATPLDTLTTVALRSTGPVAPLLGGIKWNQDSPYNAFCPSIAGTTVVTGCIATAMAQIMKYHQWPEKGIGSNTYTSTNCGVLTANFGETTYDWANATPTYTGNSSSTEKSAVATLMFHCGVAVNMNYNTAANGGSGATMNNAGSALIKNFGYDSDLQLRLRSYYSTSEWENIIKIELNASRPVFYSGSTGTSGHAFVCDGYDSNNLYHINWGWGGSSNGYFELSSLQPSSAGIGGATGGYSQIQSIVTGIQKPDNITNTTYEIGLWDKGLTPSVTTVSNISTTSFNLNFGFINRGLNEFSGEFGVGLYKNGVFQKTLQTRSTSSPLMSNYGYTDFTFSGNSLSGLTPGAYQIFCIYKPTSASLWSMVKKTATTNNYVDVIISGTSASIVKPSASPSMALTQAIQQIGNAYLNKTASFAITVKNTGTEFYSNLGVKLFSTTEPNFSQNINYGTVCIPSGETKTFNFSGIITCTPGSYYAVAVYDSLYTYSSTNFKQIGPALFSQLPVTIYSEPAAADLRLTNSITLSNTTVTRNENVTISASIANMGGFSDTKVCAFVFIPGTSTSVAQFTQKTVGIDTNETQIVTLTGALDLAPGNYRFGLAYLRNGSWYLFSAQGKELVDFTLIDQPTKIENIPGTGFSLYPNPVKDQLTIETQESIRQIQLSDISGRIILKNAQGRKTLSVSHLQAGIYILRIETEKGIKILKFIKE